MMRNHHLFVFALLFVALNLSGCVIFPRQHFDSTQAGHIKTVGLITTTSRIDYDVKMQKHPGTSFGLIGGLIEAAETSSKSARFSEASQAAGLNLRALFKQQLSCLDERYRVIAVVLAGLDDVELLESYSGLEPNVDAYLDVRLAEAGYRAQQAGSPYVPDVLVKARLIGAEHRNLLYQATVHYGEPWSGHDGLVEIAEQGYRFGSFNRLMADIPRANEGLGVASAAIAERICHELR